MDSPLSELETAIRTGDPAVDPPLSELETRRWTRRYPNWRPGSGPAAIRTGDPAVDPPLSELETRRWTRRYPNWRPGGGPAAIRPGDPAVDRRYPNWRPGGGPAAIRAFPMAIGQTGIARETKGTTMEKESEVVVRQRAGHHPVDDKWNNQVDSPKDNSTFHAILIVLAIIAMYNFVGSLNLRSGPSGGTLNISTVSPVLKVTSDRTFAIRMSMDQRYPSHPARFDDVPQALSAECPSSGRHSWLVEVQGHWDIGVAYKNISRKGSHGVRLGTNRESWSIRHEKSTGRLVALHDNIRTKIKRTIESDMIQRIVIAVDFDLGVITFAKRGQKLQNLYAFKATLSQPVCLGIGLYSVDPQSTVTIV
ncbi:E3 ubiquitin-protein ligase TRIM15-like [Engraulis encrasicolus]|uniref:E3 ubiquitin-protein ligase TRIM15-like n=1 Tax=Engraulis encrasicolus TaxID=184585 RepID=UPI002FD070B8